MHHGLGRVSCTIVVHKGNSMYSYGRKQSSDWEIIDGLYGPYYPYVTSPISVHVSP